MLAAIRFLTRPVTDPLDNEGALMPSARSSTANSFDRFDIRLDPWAVEYGAYLCAFTMLAGSGYALRCGSHIRVLLLLEHSSRKARFARISSIAST